MNDVEELIDWHEDEPTNEELIKFEEAKVSAETEAVASEERREEPKLFTTKEMSLAFRDIAAGVEIFEEMHCKAARFVKVQRVIGDAVAL